MILRYKLVVYTRRVYNDFRISFKKNMFRNLGKSLLEYWKTSQEKLKKEVLMSRGKLCPKCEESNINKVPAKSWLTSAVRGQYWQELHSRSKDLFVCRSCGFSWEAR